MVVVVLMVQMIVNEGFDFDGVIMIGGVGMVWGDVFNSNVVVVILMDDDVMVMVDSDSNFGVMSVVVFNVGVDGSFIGVVNLNLDVMVMIVGDNVVVDLVDVNVGIDSDNVVLDL